MKKYQEIKSMYDIFVESINDLDSKLQIQIKKIKQEQNILIIEEKVKLLQSICENEGLDFDSIKYKYIKQKDLDKITIPSNVIIPTVIDENILIKININDKVYYYEQKENSNVYYSESNIVGIFKNNNIDFNNELNQ